MDTAYTDASRPTMPIYEYECSECRDRHEIIQRFSDPPLTHCPTCGGAMKKLVSSPAIQFKGSGFHKTDYAAPATKSSSKSEAPSTAGDSAASKSESSAAPSTPSPASPKSDS